MTNHFKQKSAIQTTVISVAELAAREAGQILRELWLQPQEVVYKGVRDPVTPADFAAQKRIRQIVSEHFPKHEFLGEEVSEGEDAAVEQLSLDAPVWIVDPIDGTSNFSRQIPLFSISIGVAFEGIIEAGVIYDPLRDELFSAVRGQGATRNGARLSVSRTSDLDKGFVALDWGHLRAQRTHTLAMLERLAHKVQTLRTIGSAALALAWIAAGRLDGYINVGLKPWDIAAGSLLISEAGGAMSQLDGRPWNWRQPNLAGLASNRALHKRLYEILAG